MKKSVKILMVVLTALFLSVAVEASTRVGESNTELGKYWLKKAVSPMAIEGAEVETWVIHYSNFEFPVYVGMLEKGNCRVYVVRTNGVEVVYTCKSGKFGVHNVPENWATMPVDDVAQQIDREDFLRQRVISNRLRSESAHLGLIASYFPELVIVG
jgi:hypothetical protein